MRGWKVPEAPISRIDPGNEKIGSELGVFQGMSFMLPGLRFNFIWIIEKVKFKKNLCIPQKGQEISTLFLINLL